MKRIGEILVENGWIEQTVLDRALAKQQEIPRRLCSLLIAAGALEVDQASRALGEQLGVPAVLQRHLDGRDRELAALIPAEIARAWWALPIGRLGNGKLIVCARDPRPSVLASLQAVIDEPIILAVAPAAQVESLVVETYGAPEEDFDVDMSTGPIASLDLDPLPDDGDPMSSLGNLELVELDDHGVTRDPTQSGLLNVGGQRPSPLSSAGLRIPPTQPPATAARPDIVVIDPPTRPPGKRMISEPVMIVDRPPSREDLDADASRPAGKTAAEKAVELAERKAAEIAAKRAAEIAAQQAAEVALQKAAEVAAQRAAEVAAQRAAELVARQAAELVAQQAAEVAAQRAAALAAQQAAALAAQQAAALAAQQAAALAAQQAAARVPIKSPAEQAAELAAQLPAGPSGPARLLARPEPAAQPVTIRPRRATRPPTAEVDDGWESPSVEARPSAGTVPPPPSERGEARAATLPAPPSSAAKPAAAPSPPSSERVEARTSTPPAPPSSAAMPAPTPPSPPLSDRGEARASTLPVDSATAAKPAATPPSSPESERIEARTSAPSSAATPATSQPSSPESERGKARTSTPPPLPATVAKPAAAPSPPSSAARPASTPPSTPPSPPPSPPPSERGQARASAPPAPPSSAAKPAPTPSSPPISERGEARASTLPVDNATAAPLPIDSAVVAPLPVDSAAVATPAPAPPVVRRPATTAPPGRPVKAIARTMQLPQVIRPPDERAAPTSPPPLKKPPPVHAITRPPTPLPVRADEPTANAPVRADEPTANAPTANAPEPTANAPTANAPVRADEPTANAPVRADEPTANAPSAAGSAPPVPTPPVPTPPVPTSPVPVVIARAPTSPPEARRIDAELIASAREAPPPAYDGRAIAAGTSRPQRRTHSPPASLADTLMVLDGVTTRDAATTAAMRFAQGRWRAALLLQVKEKSALAEAGHGMLLTEDVVASLAIPLAAPSMIALALEARAVTTDLPSDDSPVQDRLDRLLGMPRFPAAAPLVVGGSPAHVLLVGDPATGAPDEATKDLDRLATALASAYARVAT